MNNYRMLYVAALVLFLIVWQCPGEKGLSQPHEPYSNKAHNYALIIGIGDYNNWTDLKTPPKDAGSLADILIKKYDFDQAKVVLLTDNSGKKPTRNNIIDHLYTLATKLTDQDNLLVFFSGHSHDYRGESYWIPQDAKKGKHENTWLKHADLCEKYFFSKTFKAKNICILADSYFSDQLLEYNPKILSPENLNYQKNIIEKSLHKSREVIALGYEHFGEHELTEGMGLFGYHICRVLKNNWDRVIDFENLVFNEMGKRDMVAEIHKISGVLMKPYRLKTKLDDDGQFIIARTTRQAPWVDITELYLKPSEQVHEGDYVRVDAQTNSQAFEVQIQIAGTKRTMSGTKTRWIYDWKIDRIGDIKITTTAFNMDGNEGGSKTVDIFTKKKSVRARLFAASVYPESGVSGNTFSFKAETNAAAASVSLSLNGLNYEMKKSHTGDIWTLDLPLRDRGIFNYIITAKNEKGVVCNSLDRKLTVSDQKADVISVKVDPASGYQSQEFTITANTNHPAQQVFVQISGNVYPMKKLGNTWQFTKRIQETGKKNIFVIAKNIEDLEGTPKKAVITVKERLPSVPNIAAASVFPNRIHIDDPFTIQVTTDTPASAVHLVADGKQLLMKGSDTKWEYQSQATEIGTQNFRVHAQDKKGRTGTSKIVSVAVVKKPPKTVDVIIAKVEPRQGVEGQIYRFEAFTDAQAKAVILELGDKKYQMDGAGKHWFVKLKPGVFGKIPYFIAATNKSGVSGRSKTGTIINSATPVNILTVSAPKSINKGREFIVQAQTDRPAKEVVLVMDGEKTRLQGHEKNWRVSKKMFDSGLKQYFIVAINKEDKEGPRRAGELFVEKINIPDIETASVSPSKGYAGDDFEFTVQTTASSDIVYLMVDGKKHFMSGSGKNWRFVVPINTEGTKHYSIWARNKDWEEGKKLNKKIIVEPRPLPAPNVVKYDVWPKEGVKGDWFRFQASTDIPARDVELKIGKNSYTMDGAGTEWLFVKAMDDSGKIPFSIVARNEKGKQGQLLAAELSVLKKKKARIQDNKDGFITDTLTGDIKKRFQDNNDGTFTDLTSGLMWVKNPKYFAGTFEEAVEYCSSKSHKGYSGWRLPTIEEWRKVVDRRRNDPALPPGHPSPNVATRIPYWSMSKSRFGPKQARYIDLVNGRAGNREKENLYAVWPVRYAGNPN